MNRTRDTGIEQQLREGFQALAPDSAEELLRQEVTAAAGDEWYLDGLGDARRGFARYRRALIALAACLALAFTGVLALLPKTATTVYLDVNPSVSLALDDREQVVRAEAINADGQALLADTDLKGVPAEEALRILVSAMVSRGYLSDAQKVILLSVDGEDAARVDSLRSRLSRELSGAMNELLGEGVVLDQAVRADRSLLRFSRELKVSPGKADLVRRLSQGDEDLDEEELARLPLGQMLAYLQRQGVDIQSFVRQSGSLDPDELDDIYDWIDDGPDYDDDGEAFYPDGDDADDGSYNDDYDVDGGDGEDSDNEDSDGDDGDDGDDSDDSDAD